MAVKMSDEVRELFEGENYAHVATLMPDGSPQVTPMWVEMRGDRILINTDDGNVKINNIQRDPRVAISIADQGNPYRSAFIRGRVVGVRREGASEHIDRLAKKYMNVDKYPYHDPDQPRAIIEIEPETVGSTLEHPSAS